jgi:hypothetical protein
VSGNGRDTINPPTVSAAWADYTPPPPDRAVDVGLMVSIAGLAVSALSFMASTLVGLLACAVMMYGLLQPSDWRFYVEIHEPDGSKQVLWYKDPYDYVVMVASGEVKSTVLHDATFAETDDL